MIVCVAEEDVIRHVEEAEPESPTLKEKHWWVVQRMAGSISIQRWMNCRRVHGLPAAKQPATATY